MTAVSVSGSVPTTVALADVPSLKKTVIEPPSPAIAATWLLVRISPSELRMMPEPEPAPWLPLTSILTTEGSTLAATCSTEPSAAGESGVSTTCEVLWSLGLRGAVGAVVVERVPGGRAADAGGAADDQRGRDDRGGQAGAAGTALDGQGRGRGSGVRLRRGALGAGPCGAG